MAKATASLASWWLQYCTPSLEACITKNISLNEAKNRHKNRINFKRNRQDATWEKVENGEDGFDASLVNTEYSGAHFCPELFMWNKNVAGEQGKERDEDFFEDIVDECLDGTYKVIEQLVASEDCQPKLAMKTRTYLRNIQEHKDETFYYYTCKQYVLLPGNGDPSNFLHINVICRKDSHKTYSGTIVYVYKIKMDVNMGNKTAENMINACFPYASKERDGADAGRTAVFPRERIWHPSFQQLMWFPVLHQRRLTLASSQHKKSHASPLHALHDDIVRKIAQMAAEITEIPSPDLLDIIDSWKRNWQKTLQEYSEFGTGSYRREADLPVGACMVCARCSGIVLI